MATAGTLIGYVEKQLSFDRTDIGLPGLEEAHLLQLVSQAYEEYYNAHLLGGGEPPSVFQGETGYTLVSDTAINEASGVATTDTEFNVDDSSSFGTSGALAIWDDDRPDYIQFTGNSANNISGVTGIDFAHEDNDVVSLLYALPSGFNDFRSSVGAEDGVTVNGTSYTYTSGVPYGARFSIYDNGTTKYLHFPRDASGDVLVRYNAQPTTIDDMSDTLNIPAEDEWFIVWKVVEQAAEIIRPDHPMINAGRLRAKEILDKALIRRSIGKRVRFGRRVNPRSAYTW